MPATVTVHTDDASPTTAPHRISNKTGATRAVVTVTPGAGETIDSYRVRLGGSSAATGKELGSRGPVCGAAFRAGQIKCGSKLGSTSALTENIDFSETQPNADGDYTVKVYALTRGSGWNV